MKNLLLDALRQAGDDDERRTLSDSGSFDTTHSDFSTIANDAAAERQETAEELALFETSVSFAASFDIDGDEAGEVDELRQTQGPALQATAPGITVVNEVAAAAVPASLPTVTREPVLARFAPHVCILLALIAAIFWFAVQHVRLSLVDTEFTAPRLNDSDSRYAGSDDVASGSDAEQFPFIDDTSTSGNPEGDE